MLGLGTLEHLQARDVVLDVVLQFERGFIVIAFEQAWLAPSSSAKLTDLRDLIRRVHSDGIAIELRDLSAQRLLTLVERLDRGSSVSST